MKLIYLESNIKNLALLYLIMTAYCATTVHTVHFV